MAARSVSHRNRPARRRRPGCRAARLPPSRGAPAAGWRVVPELVRRRHAALDVNGAGPGCAADPSCLAAGRGRVPRPRSLSDHGPPGSAVPHSRGTPHPAGSMGGPRRAFAFDSGRLRRRACRGRRVRARSRRARGGGAPACRRRLLERSRRVLVLDAGRTIRPSGGGPRPPSHRRRHRAGVPRAGPLRPSEAEGRAHPAQPSRGGCDPQGEPSRRPRLASLRRRLLRREGRRVAVGWQRPRPRMAGAHR